MRSIISIATDITHGTIIDLSLHYQVGPGTVPVIAPQREGAVPVRHKPKDYEHTFAETVLHQGQAIMTWDHGCGFNIDHTGLVPNALSPLHALQSARDTNFFSTSVQMGGANTAFAIMLAWPPCPMQVCGDPLSLPLGTADSDGNTVIVGIPLIDYLQQVIVVIGNLVIDIFEIRKSVLDIIATKGVAAPLEILSNLIGYPLSGGEDYARLLLRALLFNTPSIVRAIVTDDPVVIKVSAGKGRLKTEIKFVRNTNGDWSVLTHNPVSGGDPLFGSNSPPTAGDDGAGGAPGADPNGGAFPQPGVGPGDPSPAPGGGGGSGSGGAGGAPDNGRGSGSEGAGGARGASPNDGAFPQPGRDPSGDDSRGGGAAPVPGFDPL